MYTYQLPWYTSVKGFVKMNCSKLYTDNHHHPLLSSRILCLSDPVHDAQSGSGVLDRTGVWDLRDGAPQEWHPTDLPGGQWRYSLSCCSECYDLIRVQYGGWRVFQCVPQPGPVYIWQCPAQSGPDHISNFFLTAGEFQPQTQSTCSYIR